MKKINFDQIQSFDNNQSQDDPKPVKKGLGKKKYLLIILGILLLAFGFFSFFLVRNLLSIKKDLLILKSDLQKVSTSFQAQNFQQAIVDFSAVKNGMGRVKDKYQKMSYARFVPYFGKFYQDGSSLLQSGQYLTDAAELALGALSPYYDLIGLDNLNQPVEVKPLTVEERLILVLETLDKINPQLDQISQKLAQAKAEIDKINPNRYPQEMFGQKIRQPITQIINLVDQANNSLIEIKPIIAYLKPLLGIPKEKVYFLIFQNDAELRPSGGFMTAYAFLSVNKGRFTPLSSFDIYTADSQFGDRLKAPDPILNYLPNVKFWHLRDMNLSPDFAESMKTFWKNYRQTSGSRDVDAIVSIDTQVLVDILKVLGQIGVSGWGNFSAETDPRCNCPQVFYELEKSADRPVSTWREERKGIIGPLMNSVLGNIMGSPRKKWPEFINVLLKDIKEKHLLIYFFDQDLQKAIENLNAGGRIKEYSGNYFHLNDCNFAGAKSNMYIQENVLMEINRESDGSLSQKVTIDYKNPAPPSNCNLEKGELCLNGLYRDWFRVYVPKGSQLLESQGSEVEVKTYEEFDKTVFEGFYGKTPQGSLKPEGKLTLTLKYRLPANIKEGEQMKFLIQKQPGTLNHEYEIKIGNQDEQFKLDADKELQFKLF